MYENDIKRITQFIRNLSIFISEIVQYYSSKKNKYIIIIHQEKKNK